MLPSARIRSIELPPTTTSFWRIFTPRWPPPREAMTGVCEQGDGELQSGPEGRSADARDEQRVVGDLREKTQAARYRRSPASSLSLSGTSRGNSNNPLVHRGRARLLRGSTAVPFAVKLSTPRSSVLSSLFLFRQIGTGAHARNLLLRRPGRAVEARPPDSLIARARLSTRRTEHC